MGPQYFNKKGLRTSSWAAPHPVSALLHLQGAFSSIALPLKVFSASRAYDCIINFAAFSYCSKVHNTISNFSHSQPMELIWNWKLVKALKIQV
jgi:hypothetical protein